MSRSHGVAWITRAYSHHPRASLLIGAGLALASILLTALQLDVKTSRQDLLNPRSEFHHRWLAYVDEFGASPDAVVVIDGPDTAEVIAAIDAVGDRLRSQPDRFRDVLDHFDADNLVAKGLYYLPDKQLDDLTRYVEQAVPLIGDPYVPLSALAALGSPQMTEPQSRPDNNPAADWTLEAATTGNTWAKRLRRQFPRYLLAQHGQLGLVLTRLVQPSQRIVPDDKPFRALAEIQRQVQKTHPRVRIGLTGLPILEHDEMQTSQQDMTWASILSVVAVTLLMWGGFGGLKYPLLGTGALLIGIAWTCGYLTLTIGHLNILSMSFGVILIGLGIDFAVHYIARYLESRSEGQDVSEALREATRDAGPPIVAGGITTSAAFFATWLTEFQGVAELGAIAGGGILLCVVATLWVLPCAIRCTDQDAGDVKVFRLLALEAATVPFWRRPWRTTLTFVGCTLFLSSGLGRLTYDHNLLNLQADGLPSVAWERKLLEETDRNTWFAVSMADSLSQVRQRKEAFMRLGTVEHVEELASLLPEVSDEKRRQIRDLHTTLARVPDSPPVLYPVRPPPPGDSANQPTETGAQVNRGTTDIGPEMARLNAQRTLAAQRVWESLRELYAVSDPQSPQLADLPPTVLSRFVGRTGKHLIRVYARDDVWHMQPLERFVKQLEQVDPRITGDPVQTYYASHQMRASYIRAAWLAAIAVGLILVLDLRRLSDVVLAALPTALGLVQLFGLMGLLGIPLNPANIIVLPLIIGIGIDDGIHVLHDQRRHGCRGRLSRATLAGIVLTSLTSMIGFGSLMLARHEGLRSLGRIVTLGIACCLITSTLLLPCLLGLRSQYLGRRSSKPASRDEASSREIL